eukprot:scaffold38275_cov44-Attheya_sp.AAC.2
MISYPVSAAAAAAAAVIVVVVFVRGLWDQSPVMDDMSADAAAPASTGVDADADADAAAGVDGADGGSFLARSETSWVSKLLTWVRSSSSWNQMPRMEEAVSRKMR